MGSSVLQLGNKGTTWDYKWSEKGRSWEMKHTRWRNWTQQRRSGEDEAMKEKFVMYDRTIVSGDPRRTEPKHFGGPSARSRFQKSYR